MNDGARAEPIGASRAFARSIAGRGAPRGSFILGVLVHDLGAGAVFRGSPGRGRPSPRPRAPPAAGRFRPPSLAGGRRPRSSGVRRAPAIPRKPREGTRAVAGARSAQTRGTRELSRTRVRAAPAEGSDPAPATTRVERTSVATRRSRARAHFQQFRRAAGVSSRRARRGRVCCCFSAARLARPHTTRREARVSPDLSAGRRVRPARFCSRARRSPPTRALRRLTRGGAAASGPESIRGGIPEGPPPRPPEGRRHGDTSKLSAWS